MNTYLNRYYGQWLVSLSVNLLLAYVCSVVCRVAFVVENWHTFVDDMTLASLGGVVHGALMFDTAAIIYVNSLYILLALLPFHGKSTYRWRVVMRLAYVVPNAISVAMNLMDAAYFSFTGKRIMANVFAEFRNEDNLVGIIGMEMARHWYFVLLAVALVLMMWRCYRHMPSLDAKANRKAYYVASMIVIVVAVPMMVCGMRGGRMTKASRPISVNDAMRYVDNPLMANVVLNTPFSLIRTFNNNPIATPTYFRSHEQLLRLYNPIHRPDPSSSKRRKNVVVIIVESFASEFVGELNRNLDGGRYKGYTPFIDSLMRHSLTFEESFSNTCTSIDAMPAVLASIPRMVEPFVLTPYSINRVNSIPNCLNGWGYETAFFHGAENQSMGFHAFANTIGFKHYYGRTEYERDMKKSGTDDFDGTWGIWDEPFLQYFCHKMARLREPFFTSVFTLSSHHPYRVPDKYKNVFREEGKYKLHKCIRYTDYALRRFFATASRQPWYRNTIFVITADHSSNLITHPEYNTELGRFRVPIMFFDPSGEMPSGRHEGIVQQIDIMPTLLGYLGYDRPYIAFGKDVLHTDVNDMWAFNWRFVAQIIQGRYLLQSDTHRVTAVYDYRNDPQLRHNLIGQVPEQERMENKLKAILQTYNERMIRNDVAIP